MIAALALAAALAAAPAPEQKPENAAPAPAAPPAAAPSAPPAAAAPAAPAQPPPEAQEAQEAIRKAMARELPALEPKPFKTASGISGSVEAAAAPTLAGDDAVAELEIPIGTDAPISCSAVPKRLDAGAAFRNVLGSVKEKVKLVAVQLTDVVEVEGSPLALGVAVYQSPSEKGPIVGLLKLAVYPHDAHSLLCLHDEPGYKATFDRIVKGLAASLKGGGEDARAAARYAEIEVMRIGQTPVGFAERTVSPREGGGRTFEDQSTQLLPRGPGDLVAMDGYAREQIDAKDLLEEGVYVRISDGEVSTKITVSRQKDGTTFAYDGEKDGKKLAGKFKTKAGLATEFWFARRLAGTAPVPKKPLVHEAYSHEANPGGALPISYTAIPAAPRRALMKLGAVQIEGDLDANGFFETGEMPIGPAKLVIRRIWSRGTP